MRRSIGWLVALALSALFVMGATYDRRSDGYPVAKRQCTRLTWTNGGGHAAQTTAAYVNGIVYRIDIIISEVTANPTVNVSYTDENSVVCLPAMNTLADATKHFKNALVNSITSSADFNPVAVCGTITVTVDPSAAVNVAGETLTVDVLFYVR